LTRSHPNVVGFTIDDVRAELTGKNLACWCPLDHPRHADVLITIANVSPGPPANQPDGL
jgi:hypothetical protein